MKSTRPQLEQPIALKASKASWAMRASLSSSMPEGQIYCVSSLRYLAS